LLKKRGKCITKLDEDGMRKVERKINKYLQSAKGQKETNTIISAFVTFKTEEGHDEAQNYIQKLYKELQEEQAQEIAKKN
jgi:hypothetical protein